LLGRLVTCRPIINRLGRALIGGFAKPISNRRQVTNLPYKAKRDPFR
jgi:hypothetical protein